MSIKAWVKRLALRTVQALLIGLHRIVGPPQVLMYNFDINAALLRAFGARVGRNPCLFPPLALHNVQRGYGNLTIGDDCIIHGHAYLDLTAPITLEDGASLGPGTIVMTHNRYNSNAFLEEHLAHTCGAKPVRFKRGCGVKAGAVVIMGVTVGESAVVAGGAVVNRDVPDRTFVAGVPARFVRSIGPAGEATSHGT